MHFFENYILIPLHVQSQPFFGVIIALIYRSYTNI